MEQFNQEVDPVYGEVVIYNNTVDTVEFFCYDGADIAMAIPKMKKKCVPGRCCALKANNPAGGNGGKMKVFPNNEGRLNTPGKVYKWPQVTYGQRYILKTNITEVGAWFATGERCVSANAGL